MKGTNTGDHTQCGYESQTPLRPHVFAVNLGCPQETSALSPASSVHFSGALKMRYLWEQHRRRRPHESTHALAHRKANPKHNKSPMTGSPTALCSARHNQAHCTFFICINRDSVLFQLKFCCDKEIFTLKLPITPFPWDSNCFVVWCRWESVAESIFCMRQQK